MRASIVIPTMDRERQLLGCLKAIRALKPPEGGFEVLVVDDGGARPLDRLVAEAAGGLELRLYRQRNLGPGGARNAGAARAHGELLAFVDDDVLVSPGWLRAMVQAHRDSPAAALGGRAEPMAGASRAAKVSELILELATERRERPHDPRFLPSSNVVLPARDFGLLGGFDERFICAEDRELCRRWRASGRPLQYVDGAVCSHAKNLSAGQFARQHFQYGAGAHDFWRTDPAPGGLRAGIEWDFYRRVASELGRALRRGRLARAALIVLWQLANAAGYTYAAIRSPWRRAERPAVDETASGKAASRDATGRRA
jgi:GT2 family glycosyltransferase